MKFIIILVLTVFTLNVWALPTAKTTRSEARSALAASTGKIDASGQAYTSGGCPVPNDSTCTPMAEATFTAEREPSEPTAPSTSPTYASEPVAAPSGLSSF